MRKPRDLAQGVLARAYGGGADRQARTSLPQGLHGAGRNPIRLRVHDVRGDVRRGDGLERARADVEDEVEGFVSARAQNLKQLGREVQAGRGRRRGPRGFGVGIDGLITLGVIGRREAALLAGFDDVRRQRDLAEAFGEVLDGLAGRQVEPHAILAVRVLDGDGPTSIDEEASRITRALAGSQHAPPFQRVQCGTQQQALDLAAGGTHAEEACFQHGDVVADEHGARWQQLRQVAEATMLDRPRGAAHDEQARSVAPRGRRGGDAFGREFEIQLCEAHAFRFRSWAG